MKWGQGYVCKVTILPPVKVMECAILMDHTWAYGGESWSGAQKDLDAAPRWRQSQTRAAGRKEDITHAIAMRVAVEKGHSGLFKVPTGESFSYKHLQWPTWEASSLRHSQERGSLSYISFFTSPSSTIAWSKLQLDESKFMKITDKLVFLLLKCPNLPSTGLGPLLWIKD